MSVARALYLKNGACVCVCVCVCVYVCVCVRPCFGSSIWGHMGKLSARSIYCVSRRVGPKEDGGLKRGKEEGNGSGEKETGKSLERRKRARGCAGGKERGAGLEFWMERENEGWSV